MNIPSLDEFTNGYLAYQQRERRDSIYRTARFLVDHFWGQPARMADGLGVLLLTWNSAFYRFGNFAINDLEKCILINLPTLEQYRNSDILQYAAVDDAAIKQLFASFLIALQIQGGKKQGTKSPVAVAKALHLLAPAYFPLWDEEIAKEYGCGYAVNPAQSYVRFFLKSKQLVEHFQADVVPDVLGKTLLKLIDEYNYSKYTKNWI